MEQISTAFAAIVSLAEALGVSKINQLPGCWEYQVDEQWFIALNGHVTAAPLARGGNFTVAPFHCYIEWGGLPAGEISPAGGFIAAGSEANEDTFIEALQRATEKANLRLILHSFAAELDGEDEDGADEV